MQDEARYKYCLLLFEDPALEAQPSHEVAVGVGRSQPVAHDIVGPSARFSGVHRFEDPVPIRKPVIPYPLLWEGAVRTVGSHLGRIPNCSEVPNTPHPPGNRPPRRPRPPTPPRHPSQNPPSTPPPRGLRPTDSWGGRGRPEPRGHPPGGGGCQSGCQSRRQRLVEHWGVEVARVE